MNWQPSASIDTLRTRAHLLAKIRDFFNARSAYEVDVPVLGARAVTDLHIDSVEARCNGGSYFLQSSPEYFMKRLLAAGSGDIYCLGKAFRDGEAGGRHNPEFTLLEWYRLGWDDHRLMDEVAELVGALYPEPLAIQKASYGELFYEHIGIDPHRGELSQLQTVAAQVAGCDAFNEPRATCLDLIFSLLVEPNLPDGLVLVYDYPECQAALARIAEDENGRRVARRFEAFLHRMELANGYWELVDAQEQTQRFEWDCEQRQTAGKKVVQADTKLLAALQSGLPECAGVALGVDRLLMAVLSKNNIGEVLPFSFDRL
ncbi:EF-P lysine aminoacylase GenX [bacterium SCSIO 12696]|nr:EF-P lysine aminoacylase GenX [bacterium SCSIO 12696]